jgi:hypothetical protein
VREISYRKNQLASIKRYVYRPNSCNLMAHT